MTTIHNQHLGPKHLQSETGLLRADSVAKHLELLRAGMPCRPRQIEGDADSAWRIKARICQAGAYRLRHDGLSPRRDLLARLDHSTAAYVPLASLRGR